MLPPGIFLEQQFHGVRALLKILRCQLSSLPLSSGRTTLGPSTQVPHSLMPAWPLSTQTTAQKPLEVPQVCPAVSQPQHVLSPVCAAPNSPFFISHFYSQSLPSDPKHRLAGPLGSVSPWIPSLRAPITLDYKCLLAWEHL